MGAVPWAAVLAPGASAGPALAVLPRSLAMGVTVGLVQAEEIGAAAAEEGHDEASVVSFVCKNPGFGG